MHTLKFLFVGFLLLVFNASCSNETTSDEDITENILDTSKVFEAFDVAYGDAERQKFDIYLPANRTLATKTVILIHGGGWTSGSKADMNAFKLLITQQFSDIAVVNMNYRLANANNKPYPMQIEDITNLVAFLRENKTKYSISEDIGFIGISAGAHLSLLWSYAFDTNNKVDMVCSIVGPTNLTDPEYLNNTNPELQNLLDLFGIDPTTEFLEEVSPFHQVTATAPPTILFYGGKDPLIPISQGTDLRDKLQSVNVTHEFTLYDNAGHGWTGLELLDTWSKLNIFMETHL
ncbi:alpha/beta hydrolase [Jejuia pallidilutea]|uniref:Lipase n=2 Tax=Jejuia pallidilutea TaxID=504487 RepID=A0A090VT19_9FLAO|nr:alpha/beta hydrolase [Jejuia pallidilutea]GAL67875.1 lipase [Jejuia pallidilutea]GAL89931.1 lipase [Jejuia pallidilutea]